MKFDDKGASSPRLNVLMVTDSIEPSGLGEHMITLAGALPPGVRATLVFPATYAGLASARRARDTLQVYRQTLAGRDVSEWNLVPHLPSYKLLH